MNLKLKKEILYYLRSLLVAFIVSILPSTIAIGEKKLYENGALATEDSPSHSTTTEKFLSSKANQSTP